LPKNVPLIATTAIANDRVVADVQAQLGTEVKVLRGPLTRASLRIQTINLRDQADRLAWLAENLPKLPGTGIIYCLTVGDCRRVASWLQKQGIYALDYYGDLGNEERQLREQKLLKNELKALVATVALGMGFDKPDLGFVVHFQRPGSLIAYYQQIGRAGRALANSYAILLNGREDDEIQTYFIETAFPDVSHMEQVIKVLDEAYEPLGLTKILAKLNLSQGKLEKCLKQLEIEGIIARDERAWFRTANPWQPEYARAKVLTAQRYRELARIKEFAQTKVGCLMEFVARDLDDPYATPCGKCANCLKKEFFPTQVEPNLVQKARNFLHQDYQIIEPRKKWPNGGAGSRRGLILPENQNQEGRSLCYYKDAGWGQLVHNEKFITQRYGDELLKALLRLIRNSWRPEPAPGWLTVVPSLNHPTLLKDFGARLAGELNIPFHPLIEKVKNTPQQKEMQNSYQQAGNVVDTFKIKGICPTEPVFLLDDITHSGWTLTVCGLALREAGSGPVFPLALATTL